MLLTCNQRKRRAGSVEKRIGEVVWIGLKQRHTKVYYQTTIKIYLQIGQKLSLFIVMEHIIKETTLILLIIRGRRFILEVHSIQELILIFLRKNMILDKWRSLYWLEDLLEVYQLIFGQTMQNLYFVIRLSFMLFLTLRSFWTQQSHFLTKKYRTNNWQETALNRVQAKYYLVWQTLMRMLQLHLVQKNMLDKINTTVSLVK